MDGDSLFIIFFVIVLSFLCFAIYDRYNAEYDFIEIQEIKGMACTKNDCDYILIDTEGNEFISEYKPVDMWVKRSID